MTEEIYKILSKRTEFLNHLDKDIEKNEKIYEEIQADLKSLEETQQNIKELGTQPEHTALIPLCKKLYVPGRIIHTGEYMVKNKAYPHSYFVLKTLNQTLNDLEDRINTQRKLLEKAKLAIPQLEDRKKLLLGQADKSFVDEQEFIADEEYGVSMQVATMPEEIKSDKGVAIKVGGFYEILEYED